LEMRRPRVRIVRALRVDEGHKDHLMRAAISAHQWSSAVISGHQRIELTKVTRIT